MKNTHFPDYDEWKESHFHVDIVFLFVGYYKNKKLEQSR